LPRQLSRAPLAYLSFREPESFPRSCASGPVSRPKQCGRGPENLHGPYQYARAFHDNRYIGELFTKRLGQVVQGLRNERLELGSVHFISDCNLLGVPRQ